MKERAFLYPQQSTASSEVQSQRGDLINSVSTPVSFWSQLAARVRAWFEVPFGYEDEQGFHYGQQSAPQLAAQATVSRARVLTDRACQVMKHSVVLPVAGAPEQSVESANASEKPQTVPR